MYETLNFNHLRCFWAIAEEGSIARAARAMRVSHSTLSVQLHALEDVLGRPLFERRGRGLAITPLGDDVRAYAAQIFRLGRDIVELASGGASGRVALRVGAVPSLPRSVTCRLLEPGLDARSSLDLQHGPLDRLLEALAAGRLHVVLAEQAPVQGTALRLHAHPLGESAVVLYGSHKLVARLRGPFPGSLHGAPMLLPRPGSPLRRSLDTWLAARSLQVTVVGEIDDAAALRALGLRGRGLFPVRTALAAEAGDLDGARRLGVLEGISECYFAITRERTHRHPAVARLVERARARLD